MRKRLPVMENVDVDTLPVEKRAQTSLGTQFGKREEVNVEGITMPRSWRHTAMRGKRSASSNSGFSLSSIDYQRK